MLRIVALIILFMGMTFTVVTNIAARHGGGKGVNPIAAIGNGLKDMLNGADDIAPEISNALSRAELNIPKIGKKATTGLAMAMEDLSGADFSGQNKEKAIFASALATNAIFVNTLLDGATFEGAAAQNANLKKARLSNANLNAALFPGADFSDADLSQSVARAADFTASHESSEGSARSEALAEGTRGA